MWTIGTDGIINFVNNAALKMFGYSNENQMIGKHSHALVHHSHPDGSGYQMEECPIYKAFQKGISAHLEDEVLWRADGSSFYADYRSVPLYSGTEIIGAVVTFLDNTEKKKTLEDLQISQAWHAATLKGIGDAVITTNSESPPKVSFLNPIAETLTGWKNNEAIGKSVKEVFNIINQQTRLAAVNPIDRVIKEGVIVGLANHTILISRDKTEYVIEHSAAPIKGTTGEILGVVLVFRDVTKERLSRNLLEIAQGDITDAIESTSDAFFSVDRDWKITAVNTAHEKITYLSREKQIGQSYFDLFMSAPETENTKYRAEFTRAIQTNVPVKFEEYFEPLKIWASVSAYPKKMVGSGFFIVILPMKSVPAKLQRTISISFTVFLCKRTFPW